MIAQGQRAAPLGLVALLQGEDAVDVLGRRLDDLVLVDQHGVLHAQRADM